MMKKLRIAFQDKVLLMDEHRRLVMMGRNVQNDVLIDGDCVSRYHLRLEQRNDNYFIIDESQNGTFVYSKTMDFIQFVHRTHYLLGDDCYLSLGKPCSEADRGELVNLSLVWQNQEGIADYQDDPTIAIVDPKQELPSLSVDDLQVMVGYLLDDQERIAILLDGNMFIRYYTKGFEKAISKPLKQMLGKDILPLVHREERQSFFDLGQQAILQRTSLQGRFRIATDDPPWAMYHFQMIANQSIGFGWNGLLLLGAVEGSMGERYNYLDHRYELKKELQFGNFVSTYLAVDHSRPGHPKCIIKELKLGGCLDPKKIQIYRRLFNAEANTLERLGLHDRIPFLVGFFERGSSYYLVQDYIEGTKLSDVLRYETWQEREAIDFLMQMLNILKYVHSQNVIHRDIKPDNIIRRSFDGAYVLIDFGSVKLIPATILSEAQPQTQPLTIPIGTLGYVALEQKLGKPSFSSDLYSLGVVTVEALVRAPFEEVKRDWPKTIPCSPELKEILVKMVEDNVANRWQTATEVYNALVSIKTTYQ